MRIFLALIFILYASMAQAATRFWVGGAGTWDAATTTHWSATTGGAGGASVPGTADTVTFDGASGGGTVTTSTNIAVQSLTTGAFTGTLDFCTNNNTLTLTVNYSGTGTATRTICKGTGAWSISGTSLTPWNNAVVTGLTWTDNGPLTISSQAAGGIACTFAGGGLTYNSVTFSNNISVSVTGSNTIGTLGVVGTNWIYWTTGTTNTISNAYTLTGTGSAPIGFSSSQPTANATISVPSGTASLTWGAIRGMAFTGGATFTATNAFNFGENTGITITPPSGGGGGGGGNAIIGG